MSMRSSKLYLSTTYLDSEQSKQPFLCISFHNTII